jgi:hypothetical protein
LDRREVVKTIGLRFPENFANIKKHWFNKDINKYIEEKKKTYELSDDAISVSSIGDDSGSISSLNITDDGSFAEESFTQP